MTNTHITIGGHKVSAGKVYSTSEVRTGDVWIDGKPIYRKTYSLPISSMTTVASYQRTYDISALSIDVPIKIESSFFRTGVGNTTSTIAINGNSTINVDWSTQIGFTQTLLVLTMGGSIQSTITHLYSTLFYTKTTD